MVQAFEEVVAEVTAPPAAGDSGQLPKLNNPFGFNNVVPPIAGYQGSTSDEWYLPHTAVWKWIFGEAHKHPNPKPLTQAQGNQLFAQALGNLLAIIATVATAANNAMQDLQHQITVDVTELINLTGSDVAGLAQQIAQVRAGIGSASASAVADAVQQANRYTDGLVSRVANSLGAQITSLTAQIHHVDNDLINGLRSTLTAAKAYTDGRIGLLAGIVNARLAEQAATEKSDTLNLGHRIDSVTTRLEGDITQGDAATLGAAAGLVAGLGVPALRSQVDGLASQVAQVATEADQCLTPLCDTVTPSARQLGRLGNFLKGLEGAGEVALLAGLVAAAVEDPQAAATAVEDAGGWVSDVAFGLAQAVGG